MAVTRRLIPNFDEMAVEKQLQIVRRTDDDMMLVVRSIADYIVQETSASYLLGLMEGRELGRERPV
jgi:hypothetical protein